MIFATARSAFVRSTKCGWLQTARARLRAAQSNKLDYKIIETSDWSNSKDKIALNQDLKNQLDDELINVIKANGVINIKTFNIIYLNEYVNNKFSKFIVIKLFRIPSIENIFKFELSLLDIILFSFKIS